MARLNNYMSAIEKRPVRIVTVDPETNRLEGATQDGAIVQLYLRSVPAFFQWPTEGEIWMAYRENGNWILRERFETLDDDFRLKDLEPGDSIIKGGKIYTAANTTVVQKYTKLVGNGVATSFTITHNLNTLDVQVVVREATNPPYNYAPTANVTVSIVDEDTVTVVFTSAPATNAYSISIFG